MFNNNENNNDNNNFLIRTYANIGKFFPIMALSRFISIHIILLIISINIQNTDVKNIDIFLYFFS